MLDKIKILLTIIMFIATVFLLVKTVANYINMPTVYKSWSTGKCVRVESNECLTCKDLNKIDHYELVWTK